jgi:hypothetical protein
VTKGTKFVQNIENEMNYLVVRISVEKVAIGAAVRKKAFNRLL